MRAVSRAAASGLAAPMLVMTRTPPLAQASSTARMRSPSSGS